MDLYKSKLLSFRHSILHPNGVGIILLCLIGLPVLSSWLKDLSERPWQDSLIQAGTLILLLSAIIKIIRRQAFCPVPSIRQSWTGLAVLIFFAGIHFAADFFSVKSVYWSSYIGILAGYSFAISGWSAFLRWLPFFMFSAFMLPTVNAEIQYTVSMPLQIVSPYLSAAMAGLWIPLTHGQTMLYIRDAAFRITPECSGLQSWMGFLFAGLLWQIFEETHPLSLLLLIPGSLVLAVFLNMIRLSVIALTAYYLSSNQANAVHACIDYLLFPFGLAILFLTNRFFQPKFPPIKNHPNGSSNEQRNKLGKLSGKSRLIHIGTFCVLGCLIIGHWLLREPTTFHPGAKTAIPMQIQNWVGQKVPLTPKEQKALIGSKVIRREYSLSSEEDPLRMTAIETPSMAQMHNFFGCLMVQGIQPRLLKTLSVRTDSGLWKASLLEYEYQGEWFYQVYWYQWGAQTAENRWEWYKGVISERVQGRSPKWRIITVLIPQDRENQVKNNAIKANLISFSQRLYEIWR